MAVTAKVFVSNLITFAGNDNVQVSFAPDYQDDRNKEWAAATPALHLVMTVKAEVGELFKQGGKYTLTFDLDE